LMIQATGDAHIHRQEAEKLGLSLLLEAFADRCYDDDGRLLSRRKPGAIHSKERMLTQVRELADSGSITTVSGKQLTLDIDSLCVHGDNDEGVQAIREIRSIVSGP
ncbi:MAG: LamB/YcsF family protein, partial [Pseudomonadota bacterium]